MISAMGEQKGHQFDQKITENHQKSSVKIQKNVIFLTFVYFRGRCAKRAGPRKPFRAPAREARRSSRVQHKSTNTAEAHDSEQKALDMQHKTL